MTATILLVILLTACGQSSGGAVQNTQTIHGTLIGDVEASPTCAVDRTDQPCPPSPVSDRSVQILDASGNTAATTSTDSHGQFSVMLPPGKYVVTVAIVSGQIGMRQTTPGDVMVTSEQTARITIMLDTGIR